MDRNRFVAVVVSGWIAGAALSARAATTEFFDHAAFRAAADAATVVIDFEDTGRGDGLALESEFAEQGLTIVARDGQPMNVVTVGAGFAFAENANSPAQVLSSSIGLGGTFVDRSDSFDFVFGRPKRAAGLWIGNVDPGTTGVEFLDAEGAVLASETIDGSHAGVVGTPGGPNRIFYGVVSDTPVARIRTIEGTGDSDGVSYDDVEFEAATEFFDQEAFEAQAGWRIARRDFEGLAGTISGSEYAEASPDGVRIVHRGGGPISIVTATGPLAGNASSGLPSSPRRSCRIDRSATAPTISTSSSCSRCARPVSGSATSIRERPRCNSSMRRARCSRARSSTRLTRASSAIRAAPIASSTASRAMRRSRRSAPSSPPATPTA